MGYGFKRVPTRLQVSEDSAPFFDDGIDIQVICDDCSEFILEGDALFFDGPKMFREERFGDPGPR